MSAPRFVVVTHYTPPKGGPVVNVYGAPDWDRRKANSMRSKIIRSHAVHVLNRSLTVRVRQVCDIDAMNAAQRSKESA